MKNKYLAFLLVMVMIFTSACTGNGNEQSKEVISPAPQTETADLTIIMSDFDYDRFMSNPLLNTYEVNFEKAMGVKVNLEKVTPGYRRPYDYEYQDEYVKKASTRLYEKDGPELIFSDVSFIDAAIEQGAVLDVKDKIPNISKMYAGFIRDKMYYVPIGVKYSGRVIKRQMLKDLNLKEPDYSLTYTDYNKLLNQWIAKANMNLTANEYMRLFTILIYNNIGRDSKRENIKINTPEVIEGIAKLRQEMFSGKYKTIEGYTYQNYYNALWEENSKEFELLIQLETENKNYMNQVYIGNILNLSEISMVSKKEDAVILPNFPDESPGIDTMGFMINKNGKNIELAYEFINGLLSNERQLEIFKNGSTFYGNSSYYPVNKDIEAEILKLEEKQFSDPKAAKLKKYALSKLKEGQLELELDRDYKILKLRLILNKDLDKLILTDSPIEGEALKSELQKLEDKYNIWLNE